MATYHQQLEKQLRALYANDSSLTPEELRRRLDYAPALRDDLLALAGDWASLLHEIQHRGAHASSSKDHDDSDTSGEMQPIAFGTMQAFLRRYAWQLGNTLSPERRVSSGKGTDSGEEGARMARQRMLESIMDAETALLEANQTLNAALDQGTQAFRESVRRDDEPTLFHYGPAWMLSSADALCLAAHAALRFAGIEYSTVAATPEMCPDNTLPALVRSTGAAVSGFEAITTYASIKGLDFTTHLEPLQAADAAAVMAHVRRHLYLASEFELWCLDANFDQIAKPLYTSSFHVWPLDSILARRRRQAVEKKARASFGSSVSAAEVYEAADKVYAELSDLLAEKPFFFGSRPSPVDALVYGHLAFVLGIPLPSPGLRRLLLKRRNLVNFKEHIEYKYFPETPDSLA